VRFALGKPELDEEDNMKNDSNYRLVQERLLIVLTLVKLAREILELLNMSFSYPANTRIFASHGTQMVV